MRNFLSGVAVILSLIAGLIGAFTTYRISAIEQQVENLNESISSQQKAQKNIASDDIAETPPPQNVGTDDASIIPAKVANVQPGQFVQPALENRAEIELLTVKRIQDPDTGARDVVNVQFRVRRTGKAGATSVISPVNTTARSPNTGETYDSYRTAGIKADKEPKEDRATPGVRLLGVKEGASVDAYVWLKVPEGVNSVDIYIPETQPFRTVPIASQ